MRVLKIVWVLFCIGCLFAVLVMASGCTTAPKPSPHGKLVQSWWVSLEKNPDIDFRIWDPITHMCKYEDGVVINVGRKPCP